MPRIGTPTPDSSSRPQAAIANAAELAASERMNCTDCGVEHGRTSLHATAESPHVCEACIDDHYIPCADCGTTVHNDNSYVTAAEEYVCYGCRSSNYRTCDGCGGIYPIDDIEDGVCSSCAEARENADNGPVSGRRFKDDPSFISKEPGTILTTARPFGIELELGVTNTEFRAIAKALPKNIGIGGDGSIQVRNGKEVGMEIATPRMAGKTAETMITDMCKVLAKNKAAVNSSCGFHVHIDGNDIDNLDPISQYKALKMIWLFYIAFEDTLLSFLPPSRRDSKYCVPLRADYHFKEISDTKNMDDLEKLWYRVPEKVQLNICKSDRKHQSRYRGINMHTLLAERHLEIRYHSGTVQAKKILEWINLHTQIVDLAVKGYFDTDILRAACMLIDMPEKTKMFFSMLHMSDESRDYFLVRQKKFMPPIEYNGSAKAKKEAEEALSTEQEG